MNYNTPNETSLLDLIGALKNGLDPTTAYGIYQNVQQDQAAQIAQRQERLGGLAELLSGTAMQGMPYSGAQALAEAQPGPAGPAVQSMLQSLYPQGEEQSIMPAQPMNASGQTIPAPLGYGASAVSPVTGSPMQGPQSQSPAFQPVEPSPTEALAMQEAQTNTDIAASAQSFAVDASKAAMQGQDMQTFLRSAAQYYPELFADPEGIKLVQQIAITQFQAPVPTAGV